MGKMMQVRGPDELKKYLNYLAKKKGFSRNALMLKVLWEYVEKENVKEQMADTKQVTSKQATSLDRGAEICQRK